MHTASRPSASNFSGLPWRSSASTVMRSARSTSAKMPGTEQLLVHVHLRRGQADAGRGVHRHEHLVDQIEQRLIEHRDGLGLGAQARIGEFEDFQHRREFGVRKRASQAPFVGAKSLRRFGTWRDISAGFVRQSPQLHDASVCAGKNFVYTREALGESGNWQPCLKNYLQFLPDCC
jgi:hypothetical protein